jgi:hypothetical protein
MSILVTSLLAAAAMAAGQGQDATRSGAQSANQSSSASSVAPPEGGSPTAVRTATGQPGGAVSPASPASGGAPGAGGTGAANGADKPPPVCFKLTGRCVEPAKGPAAKGGTATLSKVDPTAKQKPLNLAAPDVRSVVPAEELKQPLPQDEQITEIQESETVAVKGNPEAPDVPGGFGAIWWALNHPSQAWRILAPAE